MPPFTAAKMATATDVNPTLNSYRPEAAALPESKAGLAGNCPIKTGGLVRRLPVFNKH